MSKQRIPGESPSDSGPGISRREVVRAGGASLVAALAGCSTKGATDSRSAQEGPTGGGSSSADSMTIFHAGSLEAPFAAAQPAFEREYDVAVNREAKGSVASTKKITDQGRVADVLAVSDFRLLRDSLLPEFGRWYAIFTTNAMTIQYRADSPGADDISTDTWWEVLSRDDVTIGHSDPALDPGGYRAVMTQQLGAIEFEGSRLYDRATYETLRENSTVPTGTETNLKGQLESGKLDYAIYYRSISEGADMPYVELQPRVDLSRATSKYAEHYARATVETASGTFSGAPIAYGITVPEVADAPTRGAQWVDFLLGGAGDDALRDTGFVPVEPAVIPESSDGSLPEPMEENATAQPSLGPMEL